MRHCTVHNLTEDEYKRGNFELYYNPEERGFTHGVTGVNTFDKCKNWCFEDLYCGLALWYEEKEECFAYRFKAVKKNETEELRYCRTGCHSSRECQCYPFYDFEAFRDPYAPTIQFDFLPSKFISCTSYQGNYLNTK